jgi:hypothetical protein
MKTKPLPGQKENDRVVAWTEIKRENDRGVEWTERFRLF